jgi:putative solute:sodium symporter small subunit
MENNQNEYHVSFFKPVSPRATKNRNMTLWLVAIWAVAIFGFQILLKVTGKPTPEPAHVEFIQVWDKVQSGNADDQEMIVFSKSVLQVLAKVYIKADFKSALENAFSWSVFQLVDEEEEQFLGYVHDFERVMNQNSSILDSEYLSLKLTLESNISALLNITSEDARRIAIPFSVKSNAIKHFSEENKAIVASAMDLYLIHNRSVLTDTKFLGFPFHYFYTAVFLLCLFIGLCWIYCVRTDKIEMEHLMS